MFFFIQISGDQPFLPRTIEKQKKIWWARKLKFFPKMNKTLGIDILYTVCKKKYFLGLDYKKT